MRRLHPPGHPASSSASTLVTRPYGGSTPEHALVATADFITPIVDDPRGCGDASPPPTSASDVYAIGGRPLFGLNLVGWNSEELSTEIFVAMLDGLAEAAVDGG